MEIAAMREVALSGTLVERWTLAGTPELPDEIVAILAADPDLDVVSTLLTANVIPEQSLLELEDRLRALGYTPGPESALFDAVGCQPHASIEAKLAVYLEFLQLESVNDALDRLNVPPPVRERIYAMYRRIPELITFRDALHRAGYDYPG